MHPCCGNSLQNGTKIVAIVEIVLNILSIIGLIVVLVIGFGAYQQANTTASVSFSRSGFGVDGGLNMNDHSEGGFGHGSINNDSHGGNINVQLGDGQKTTLYAAGLVLLIIYLITMIMSIIGLLMAIFLLMGAKERNIGKCKAWLIWTAVWWVLSIISVFFGYYHGIFALVLNAYFMWVVYAFMKEVETEGGAGVGYSEPGATPRPKV